jgi:hypothetical protein
MTYIFPVIVYKNHTAVTGTNETINAIAKIWIVLSMGYPLCVLSVRPSTPSQRDYTIVAYWLQGFKACFCQKTVKIKIRFKRSVRFYS